jgi:hypothetical protein
MSQGDYKAAGNTWTSHPLCSNPVVRALASEISSLQAPYLCVHTDILPAPFHRLGIRF